MTTLILAEPQSTTRGIWQRDFERAGFQVLPAADEDELDSLLGQAPPDAFVADRRLVGPAGERVRRLRQGADRGPVCVILALLPTGPDRRLLLAAGADWYIHKTAFVSHLPNVVRALLGQVPPLPPPPRAALRALVALPVDYCHAGRVGAGETLNLSEDGMFIKTASPAEVGTLLLLGFALPDGRRLECFARVVWSRGCKDEDRDLPGMGVQFFDLDPEMRAALAAFVTEARAALPVPG